MVKVLALMPEDSKILTSHKREFAPCLSPILAYLAKVTPAPKLERVPPPMLTSIAVDLRPRITSVPPWTGRAVHRFAGKSIGSMLDSLGQDCSSGPWSALGQHCFSRRRAARRLAQPSVARRVLPVTARAMRGATWPTNWRRWLVADGDVRAALCVARGGARATRLPNR